MLIGKLMSKFAEISDSNHGAHLSSMVFHCRFSQMGHLKSVQHHAVVPKIGLRLSFAYLLVHQGPVTNIGTRVCRCQESASQIFHLE